MLFTSPFTLYGYARALVFILLAVISGAQLDIFVMIMFFFYFLSRSRKPVVSLDISLMRLISVTIHYKVKKY